MASTNSRSARPPPKFARCARPSRTRARAFATRASTCAARSGRGLKWFPRKMLRIFRGAGLSHRFAREALKTSYGHAYTTGSPYSASSPGAEESLRDGRAASPGRLPLQPRNRGAADRRRRGEDSRLRELAAAEEVVQGHEDPAGRRGGQVARREREEGRDRGRRLRPRRVPVPRPGESARRQRTRGRTEVLSVNVQESRELKERVVEINRVAKVVKGGRRFSFTALVVIGDEVDRVGVGYGKAREVPLAITKAVEDAKKNLFTVPKHGTTITHEILGRSDAARVLLRPASEGTGVIAGGGVRAVLELAGIRDILAKSLGTTNPINMAKATVNGLKNLRRPEDVAKARGLTINQVLPYKAPAEDEPAVSGSEPLAPIEPSAPPADAGEGT